MMRPKLRHELTLLTALTVANAVTAQIRAIEVAPFPGLAETSRATALREGPDGRIWVAFRARVQSHDGEQVTTIELGHDADGRRPAVVRALEIAHDDSLWIGTERGLWRLDPIAETAQHWPGSADLNVLQIVRAGSELWIRAPRSLAVRRGDGHIQAVELPDGTRSVGGLLADADGIWAWTRSGIWRRPSAGGDWQAATWVPEGLRHVFLADGRIVCVTENALVEYDPDGTRRRTIECEGIGATTAAAIDATTYWLAGYGQLFAVDRVAGTVRPVELWQRGIRLEEVGLFAILVDAQGLLWLSTDTGVCRSCVARGIDNVVLADFERHETVASLAELPDGRVLLGTSRGALWQQEGAAWRRVETPWPPATADRTAHLSVLVAIDGDLYAGTQDALWRRRADVWQAVGADAGLRNLRVAFADADGTLWTSDRMSVWRLDRDDAITCVPLQEIAGINRKSITSLHRDANGILWIGSNPVPRGDPHRRPQQRRRTGGLGRRDPAQQPAPARTARRPARPRAPGRRRDARARGAGRPASAARRRGADDAPAGGAQGPATAARDRRADTGDDSQRRAAGTPDRAEPARQRIEVHASWLGARGGELYPARGRRTDRARRLRHRARDRSRLRAVLVPAVPTGGACAVRTDRVGTRALDLPPHGATPRWRPGADRLGARRWFAVQARVARRDQRRGRAPRRRRGAGRTDRETHRRHRAAGRRRRRPAPCVRQVPRGGRRTRALVP